jgi:hypothetical protein
VGWPFLINHRKETKHMKLIILSALMLFMAADANAGLFDNGEKDRRIQAEQQLQQERGSAGGWMIVAGIMGVGGISLFVIGTALGSRIIRRHGKQ